ncbi:uncharacterized protein LOC133805589 [Humulus lupulus]|uniref:uncharacterized protein LOC133805589 n=1 Tax=Humulus lupulus TaxID=3486 RepID=UPI002B40C891|nr:uncharacterized protein LOC133805589 [Humulus lupulus]
MAKKKRVVRKPAIQSSDHGSLIAAHDGEDVEDGAGSSAGLNLIAEVVNSGENSPTTCRHEHLTGSKDDPIIQRSSNWAKEMETMPDSEVGTSCYHESAKSHWQSFSKENMFVRDPMLSYSEPLIKNGMRIAQVDLEEVIMQAANWSSAVICMVLGANPPMAVFEGFIKRIWGHLGIAQVARMSMGLIMVRFNDDATRNQVLESGVLHFDRKPVIIRPWTTDLNALKLVQYVPLWIRLHDLGLQYWGNKSLSALVSTVGKPIMVNQHTKERTRVQFARVLVEMDITDSPPRIIQFLNEHGQLVEQGIDYEWLPVKCKHCSGYGHLMADCRKGELVTKGKLKVAENSEVAPKAQELKASVEVERVSHDVPLDNKDKAPPTKDKEWLTPKRTVQTKGQGTQEYDKPGSARQAVKSSGNAFSILQDSGTSLEKGPVPIEAKGSGVGALIETKLKDNKVTEMMMTKFSGWEYYNSPVIEGRLLIIWRKKFVRVIVISESPQFVHCYVKMAGQDVAFCATFVYGLNTIDVRKSLWEDLLKIKFPVKPWILLGDFNAVFNCEDRFGGVPIAMKELNDSTLWLAQAHVEALKRTGSFFTWSNNQEGASRIYSRIDHALVNEDWHDIFPYSFAHFSWETSSDHCSCVIAASISEKIRFKPFRYFNFWADHQDFKGAVLASWEKPLAVKGLKGLYYKLMRLKHSLKKFNKTTIGDVGTAFTEARNNYIEARLQAQTHPSDIEYQHLEKSAAEVLSRMEKMYFSFLRQRSKINWLQQGDENTAFFHAYLKKRKVENRIATFVTDQGMINDKFSEVVDHFLNHFRGYMGSRSTNTMSLNSECMEKGAKLSLEQELVVLNPFSNKEIKRVLFSIPDDKSPGPDGYGSGFFKTMWPVLGAEFCSAILDFFNSGNMPSEFHATMISLIPKKDSPSRAIDYRPIACCSTVYKCIAKLMCLRLAEVLPSLVNQNQGAFIKGRSLAHNVMILQDLLKNYQRKIVSPRCTIKIDISKAYDTVSWDFLEALLTAFNFPGKFVQRVMSCVRSTTYSLSMNGRVQGSFKGEKGLRQGDPLSPLLFVLIMEYLTRRLQLAANHSLFRYHPMCKGLNLINLCFADDLILFSKGTRQSLLVLKEVLDEFSNTTGLTISKDKSQVFFGGVQASERSIILSDFHLTEGDFPFKYLGVPLRPTKWRAEDCGIIIKKINQILHSWASRHLSFAGRIQLIHSVLFGLRNYWMSIFVLPHSVTKEVEKICRGFLWGTNGTRSKVHVASWDKVCLPKPYGGLGFKNGVNWNCAILAKFIWAISDKSDLLWVKWINTIYLKGTHFWAYDLKPDSSWYWRKLCYLRRWFTKSDVEAAGCLGKFRSAALYNSLLLQSQVCPYYKAVWNSLNIPKHRFMLWKMVNSQLLTRDNLVRLHLDLVTLDCPVCGISPESHDHLFYRCRLSSQIVDQIFEWLGVAAWPKDFRGWVNWLSMKMTDMSSEDMFEHYKVVAASSGKKKDSKRSRGESSKTASKKARTEDPQATVPSKENTPPPSPLEQPNLTPPVNQHSTPTTPVDQHPTP